MQLNLCEFILRSWRENVPWAVYQGSKLLIKGTENKKDIFKTIKNADIHIPSDEEIMKEMELKEKKYRERIEKLKKAKKEKAESDKLKVAQTIPTPKCKYKDCDKPSLVGFKECYEHYYAIAKRKKLITKKEEALLSDKDIEIIDKILHKVITRPK